MSLVIENTALLSEIVLRIPEVAETILGSNVEWNKLLTWSLDFSNQTQLLDTSTTKLIYLVRHFSVIILSLFAMMKVNFEQYLKISY